VSGMFLTRMALVCPCKYLWKLTLGRVLLFSGIRRGSFAWAHHDPHRDLAFCKFPANTAVIDVATSPSLPTLQLHGAFLVVALLFIEQGRHPCYLI
jgi:hypothetical protein